MGIFRHNRVCPAAVNISACDYLVRESSTGVFLRRGIRRFPVPQQNRHPCAPTCLPPVRTTGDLALADRTEDG
ncbi:hypothetical protein DPEC_G00078010 [Dallia pectoralis]|uniref:Uncharacterized protein n=1 Tax=Dallia pectoralis TaxID=75939 RepID=A0ACC2H490_DALPE|nr:hypothetical protein DPEC_G00078010 [Dallia pectoralis]